MIIINSGPYFKKNEQGFYFEVGPMWHRWLEDILDLADEISRHRLCNRLDKIRGAMYRSRKSVYFPMTVDEVKKFYSITAWDYPEWHDDNGNV